MQNARVRLIIVWSKRMRPLAHISFVLLNFMCMNFTQKTSHSPPNTHRIVAYIRTTCALCDALHIIVFTGTISCIRFAWPAKRSTTIRQQQQRRWYLCRSVSGDRHQIIQARSNITFDDLRDYTRLNTKKVTNTAVALCYSPIGMPTMEPYSHTHTHTHYHRSEREKEKPYCRCRS